MYVHVLSFPNFAISFTALMRYRASHTMDIDLARFRDKVVKIALFVNLILQVNKVNKPETLSYS